MNAKDTAPNTHYSLGKGRRDRANEVCPYCGKTIKGVPDREHMIPSTLVANRSFDFHVCRSCNKKKSKSDERLGILANLADVGIKAGIDVVQSDAVGTLQKMINWGIQEKVISSHVDGTEKNAFVIEDLTTLEVFDWIEYLVKGFYFLQKGKVLRIGRSSSNQYMIEANFLTPGQVDIWYTPTWQRYKQMAADKSVKTMMLLGENHWISCTDIDEGFVLSLGDLFVLTGSYISYRPRRFAQECAKRLRSTQRFKEININDAKYKKGALYFKRNTP